MKYDGLEIGHHVWWVKDLDGENCPEMPERYTVVSVKKDSFVYLVPGEGIVHGSVIEHRGPDHPWLFPTAEAAWDAFAQRYLEWSFARWNALAREDDGVEFSMIDWSYEMAEVEDR